MAKRSSRWRRKERGGARPRARMGNGVPGFKGVREVPGGFEVLEVVEINVGYGPRPEPGWEALPEKLKRRLPELEFGREIDIRLVMEELKYYVAMYPQVPLFEHWLAKGLYELGRVNEARAMAERTLQRHPDYFWGKLLVAEFALRRGELERVEQMLGEARHPRSFVPGRKGYHYTEVIGYFCLCGELDLRKGDWRAARSALVAMEQIAPDHPLARRLQDRCEEVERGANRRRSAADAA